MKIFGAEPSEIFLAEQRDEEQVVYVTEEISQIVKGLFGDKIWISYYSYYPFVASALYYAVTTLLGVQTVGEEYVSLLPLASIKQYKVPSFKRRLIFLCCYTVAPLLIERTLLQIEKDLEHSLTNSVPHINQKQRTVRKTLLDCIIWIRSVGIPTLYRLNISLFYLFGTYYSISKRLINLQYVSFRPQSNSQALIYFRLLGAVTIAQSVLSAVIWIRNELRSRRESVNEENGQYSNTDLLEVEDDLFANNTFCCLLCSQFNKPPACIPCGHLFCWSCIFKHIQLTSTETDSTFCPYCRHIFHRSRVVPLLNL